MAGAKFGVSPAREGRGSIPRIRVHGASISTQRLPPPGLWQQATIDRNASQARATRKDLAGRLANQGSAPPLINCCCCWAAAAAVVAAAVWTCPQGFQSLRCQTAESSPSTSVAKAWGLACPSNCPLGSSCHHPTGPSYHGPAEASCRPCLASSGQPRGGCPSRCCSCLASCPGCLGRHPWPPGAWSSQSAAAACSEVACLPVADAVAAAASSSAAASAAAAVPSSASAAASAASAAASSSSAAAAEEAWPPYWGPVPEGQVAPAAAAVPKACFPGSEPPSAWTALRHHALQVRPEGETCLAQAGTSCWPALGCP
mmetsp:Transcript_32510/g.92193  ORF Transcript_32510/g.92193 Transcript_32510/m.92193 type:complete len:315 (-) Transcript_32510:1926-2870(-)